MKNRILILATAVFAVTVGLTVGTLLGANATPVVPVTDMGGAIDPASLAEALDTPCTTEDDASNCYWDATTMGNGDGTSFVHVEGHVFPLPTR